MSPRRASRRGPGVWGPLIAVVLSSSMLSVLMRGCLRAAAGPGGVNWFQESYVPWALSFGIFAGLAVLAEWWLRRWRARQNPALCRRCFYDLSGLPARGVCPECGRGYVRPTQAAS